MRRPAPTHKDDAEAQESRRAMRRPKCFARTMYGALVFILLAVPTTEAATTEAPTTEVLTTETCHTTIFSAIANNWDIHGQIGDNSGQMGRLGERSPVANEDAEIWFMG